MVEIADSTVRKDRGIKAEIYAENGAPEYWIVDLQCSTIEVYTDPINGIYGTKRTFQRGDAVAPAAFPEASLAVDDVLPSPS